MPFPEQKQEVEPVPEKNEEVPVLEESNLTPQERKMVEDFSNQIDLSNSSMILQYGVAPRKDCGFLRISVGKCENKGFWEKSAICCPAWYRS